MRNQPLFEALLFEASFVSEVNSEVNSEVGASHGSRRSGTSPCQCQRCQEKAASSRHPQAASNRHRDAQPLFETLPQDSREAVAEWEMMEGESSGEKWFWQAVGQALLATKRAIAYLRLKQPNIQKARQALGIARKHSAIAATLAAQAMGHVARQKTLKDSIAHGYIAIQRTQEILFGSTVNIAVAVTEAKKAVGALGAAMRLATAKSGVKVWN